MKHVKRLILLLAITALNLADFSLTIWLIRTGQGYESNPIMQASGIAAVKVLAVPFLAGLTFYTADRAEKEGTHWVARVIDWIIIATAVFLGVVVANNIGVAVLHTGILNLWGF